MATYVRPNSLFHALEVRAAGAEVLSGGTDFWPARVGKPACGGPDATILDLSALSDLRGITREQSGTRIGALTTWSDLAEADLPLAFRALQMAAREVGGRQIQNRGTIAGNLCNASPAADGVPPLLTLGAQVELAGSGGVRTLPLHEFILGPRRTALKPDEVMTALLVPEPHSGSRSHFIKLGARKYQLISIVMGAALLTVRDGLVTDAAIAVGACSPVAMRLPALEVALIGARVSSLAGQVESGHLDALAPIDDVRADAEYRREGALVVVRRLLADFEGGR